MGYMFQQIVLQTYHIQFSKYSLEKLCYQTSGLTPWTKPNTIQPGD